MNHSDACRHGAILPVRSSGGSNDLAVWRRLDAPDTNFTPSPASHTSGKSSAAAPATPIQRQRAVNSRSAAASFQCDAVDPCALTPTAEKISEDTTYGASAPCGHLHGGDGRAPGCLSHRARPRADTTERRDPGASGIAAGSAGIATAPGQWPQAVAATNTSVHQMARQQALAELLNDLREYSAASPAFRHFWRVVALHNIRRFRRDHLQPEQIG